VYLRRRTGAFLVIECEGGYYTGSRGGGTAFDAEGKKVHTFKGDGGKTHAANFIAAIRSRKRADLKAEIEAIHYSSAWCHLGNHLLPPRPEVQPRASGGCREGFPAVE
jgi:hypothetical protein